MFTPIPPGPEPSPEARVAAAPDVQSDQALRELAAYVMDCLNHGSEPAEVRKSLVAKGLSEADAQACVDHVLYLRSGGAEGHDHRDIEALRAQGRRNMAIGAVVCVIGLFVTVGTMAAADGGGRVVIAWGAIVFGAIQFFRGLGQANYGRSESSDTK